MGWNDHMYDNHGIYVSHGEIVTCEHCNEKYYQRTEDQVPGCRSKDYDICPYCNKSNGSSKSIEFFNSKINQKGE